jgi:hypothetical protein
MRRLGSSLLVVTAALGALAASPGQPSPFFPIERVAPGMVGVGRTVFAGDTPEEFKAHVLGVLHNVIGPRRDLILARLEGGPLASTGVIQGMSGSPVYFDGRLAGAVSYALGSFPREPYAGITPIAEMIGAVDRPAPRAPTGARPEWPASPEEVFAFLGRLADRTAAAVRPGSPDLRIDGPAALADLAPRLRPIGAAMVLGGFDPSLDRELRSALSLEPAGRQAGAGGGATGAAGSLRPGDPIGMSLIRGDLEMGATGTVTYVDGLRVYAFGHPFLNLGTTAFPMTRSRVYGVLPSLDSSFKIATLGPIIGTVSQDRSTGIGGTLGAGPRELEMTVALTSDRASPQKFTFHVVHDQMLTPLFSYVAVLNSLVSYERQTGTMSIAARATVSFGTAGTVTVDDLFAGDAAIAAAAAAITAPVGAAAANEFRTVLPERVDVDLRAVEAQQSATIERAWLDTTKPRFGATHLLQVQVRTYRGGTETVSLPVTMPTHAAGPLTLLVSDAATLGTLEQRELRPAKPASWTGLLDQLNTLRRNNRLYVRLITGSGGAVVGGDTLPGLPPSVRSVLGADATAASAAISRSVVGAWDRRLDFAVRGSRELTITLTPPQ